MWLSFLAKVLTGFLVTVKLLLVKLLPNLLLKMFTQNLYSIIQFSDPVCCEVSGKMATMFTRVCSRGLATSAARGSKVAVLGAAGGIGQPMSLLLKQVYFSLLIDS